MDLVALDERIDTRAGKRVMAEVLTALEAQVRTELTRSAAGRPMAPLTSG